VKELAGKTAFITGGASGMGLAMGHAFAKEGMKVVLADIEKAALQQAVAGFEGSDNVHAVVLDVTDRQGWAAAADETEATFGNIHVLCNNAGVATGGSLDNASYEDWDWVIGVNLGGVFNGLRTMIDRIKAHGEGGHIVNTASMAGFIANAAGIYSTTKFAVVGLSESLRPDLEPFNIGVSVLCPAFVATQIFDSERNRPTGLATGTGINPDEKAINERMIGEGISPDRVATQVLQAIRDNALYIFPHPESRVATKIRFDQVLGAMAENPDNEDQMAFAEGSVHAIRQRSLKDPT
jgi:NAD(P)-dependent dehydrogenase (short-subunit alcohol dehydrogenase family)